MLKLEELKKDAQIAGLEPGSVVRVVTTEPAGDDAVTVYYNPGRAGGAPPPAGGPPDPGLSVPPTPGAPAGDPSRDRPGTGTLGPPPQATTSAPAFLGAAVRRRRVRAGAAEGTGRRATGPPPGLARRGQLDPPATGRIWALPPLPGGGGVPPHACVGSSPAPPCSLRRCQLPMSSPPTPPSTSSTSLAALYPPQSRARPPGGCGTDPLIDVLHAPPPQRLPTYPGVAPTGPVDWACCR